MTYVYDDGGRAAAGFKGSAGDCVTRAIAIATQQNYATVYAALNATKAGLRQTKRVRGSSARNGVARAVYDRYLASLGWHFTPTMRIGSGCTVHLTAAELPAGRLICRLSKHLTAVVDGVIRDTFDPNDRGATIYPPGTLENIPVGARKLDNGNGWVYEPLRCVYGYWSLTPKDPQTPDAESR